MARRVSSDDLKRIDALIRSGQGADARSRLARIAPASVPAEELAFFARLTWRCDLALLGVRALGPVVRPTRKGPAQATPPQTAEYAQCLTRLGALDEAEQLLNTVDPQLEPRANLYQGTLRMARWDYEGAIPWLQRYVRTPSVKGYSAVVGKVNLAASLVDARESLKATALLRYLNHETSVSRLTLLHANVLELSAQNFIFQRNWRQATRFLLEAKKFLKGTKHCDEFFVRKWEALVGLYRVGPTARSREIVSEIVAEAFERRDWETVRECDRVLAIVTEDRERFLRVYFGTPYEGYRERLAAEFPVKFVLPKTYAYGMIAGDSPVQINVADGSVSRGEGLKPGTTLHRLLNVLSSDLYRPFRIATIHARLFPDEVFSPYSSPLRVHQAIKLLKKWFSANRIPLLIEETEHFYRLRAKAPCTLLLSGSAVGGRQVVQLERLKQNFSSQAFSVHEAAKLLAISPRSTLRILDEARKEGALQREGARAKARYRFDSLSKKASNP